VCSATGSAHVLCDCEEPLSGVNNTQISSCFDIFLIETLGPVVQSWTSANPGLNYKFNSTLKFKLPTAVLVCVFYTSFYFKTSEKKTPIDPDKISEEIFPNL
jgi:hypothetical protein